MLCIISLHGNTSLNVSYTLFYSKILWEAYYVYLNSTLIFTSQGIFPFPYLYETFSW